jgi:hypothetical protein
VDDAYQVLAFQEPGAIRLDIRRHDMRDGIPWDELQRLKSACGFGDYDGVELYPRDADVINTANIRHLYIFQERLLMVRRWVEETA